MDDALNPYTPGLGLAPTVLTGRDRDLQAFDNLIKRAENNLLGRPMLLIGLRGVGKTVLLNQLKSRADKCDWLTVKVEASQGVRGAESVRRAIANGLGKASLRYRAKALVKESALALSRAVASFHLSLGDGALNLGVETKDLAPVTGNLELDLQDVTSAVAETLKRDRKALAFFIDEMQDLDEEMMEALISAQHEAGQNRLPFYIIGAGLPSLPGKVARSRSYAERMFEVHTIDRLGLHSARKALSAPAERQDVEFEDDALDFLAEASGQYPYFLQEFGSQIWKVGEISPFTIADARQAARLGTKQLDAGFFQARWDRATPAERDYLSAMAALGDGSAETKEIGERLGKDNKALGPVRAKLINKGLIYSPEHGKVRYTVPNFKEFIIRRSE